MKRSYSYNVDEENRESYRPADSNAIGKLTYLLVGGGIGALAALLFAPKAGRELRGDLADATRKSYDKTRTTAQQLRDQSGVVYQQLKQNAGNLYNRPTSNSNSAVKSNDNLIDQDSSNLNRFKDDSFDAMQTSGHLINSEMKNQSA